MTGQESQYRIPWIVFDRDQVKDFDEIIQTAEKSGVGAGWSNPCFEIWMYAYLGEMPVIRESFTCCDRFAEKFEKITRQKYSKNDRSIYQKLVQHGDEKKAIQMAERCYKRCVEDGKQKPSEMWPACRVHRLVDEIIKFSKIKPAVYHLQDVVILLVQSYKLNSVCNAGLCRIQTFLPVSP